MQLTKKGRRKRIHKRVRRKLRGTATKPRLNIFRSNRFIYCQLIDDDASHTLVAASSREPDFTAKGTPKEIAREVGKLIAQRAKDKGIEDVKFDRSGYLYHGRIRELAEGAREGGLKF